MTDIPAREGERCTVCGTPLEPIELSAEPVGSDDIVFRCANGHEQRVHRNAPGSGDKPTS